MRLLLSNNLDKAAKPDWLFTLFRLAARSPLAMQLLLLLVLSFLFQLATMTPKAINTDDISATKPFERFRQFAKKIMAVPKEEIDRREADYKK